MSPAQVMSILPRGLVNELSPDVLSGMRQMNNAELTKAIGLFVRRWAVSVAGTCPLHSKRKLDDTPYDADVEVTPTKRPKRNPTPPSSNFSIQVPQRLEAAADPFVDSSTRRDSPSGRQPTVPSRHGPGDSLSRRRARREAIKAKWRSPPNSVDRPSPIADTPNNPFVSSQKSVATSAPVIKAVVDSPSPPVTPGVEVHQDTPVEELTNFVSFSTETLDIGDEETRAEGETELESDYKENVAPVGSRPSPPVERNQVVGTKKRRVLGELDPDDYIPKGVHKNDVVLIEDDEDREVVPSIKVPEARPGDNAVSPVEIVDSDEEDGISRSDGFDPFGPLSPGPGGRLPTLELINDDLHAVGPPYIGRSPSASSVQSVYGYEHVSPLDQGAPSSLQRQRESFSVAGNFRAASSPPLLLIDDDIGPLYLRSAYELLTETGFDDENTRAAAEVLGLYPVRG